jgi:hypothetical protein
VELLPIRVIDVSKDLIAQLRAVQVGRHHGLRLHAAYGQLLVKSAPLKVDFRKTLCAAAAARLLRLRPRRLRRRNASGDRREIGERIAFSHNVISICRALEQEHASDHRPVADGNLVVLR